VGGNKLVSSKDKSSFGELDTAIGLLVARLFTSGVDQRGFAYVRLVLDILHRHRFGEFMTKPV